MSAAEGQQSVNITITGQFTNFVQGTSTVSFGGARITVNSVAVTSGTSLTANISLASNATIGSRAVTVIVFDSSAGIRKNSFTSLDHLKWCPVFWLVRRDAVNLPSVEHRVDAMYEPPGVFIGRRLGAALIWPCVFLG
jgi:hypothetical protein